MRPRRIAGAFIRRIRSVGFCRRLGRILGLRVTIRQAVLSEMAFVEAHFHPNTDAPPQPPSPGVTNYVACINGKIVGFVQLIRQAEGDSPHAGHWLYSLHVWHLYRGLGIGEALSRRVMEQAQREKAPALSLVVYNDNRPAIKMYQKLGFSLVPVPELEKAFLEEAATGRRRIVMRRRFQ